MPGLPLLFGPMPSESDFLVTGLLTIVPAVTLALFVRVSATENDVPHSLAWPVATLFAGLSDALAFGSWVVLFLYLTVSERDSEREGPISRWLIHRGRN
ncbi:MULTISPECIES: hypothetical protein [Haloarcula]|uniref:Uncharacterized protein n=1 Tax=Haloarcula pellucida TaxID=1427151 RepID=A0A830GPM1_9EURY|nr:MULTISPECIES: hypothetical protein [Halomicroarcula]MBX0349285.1 hypothetical protein [Halomicroarcula pellucida]MDS0279129.1 hypothetical protein [Halomicroarcula sp. S1AR25-4]GGN99864.1 hypothetical protein GCM10009030_31910 [Halomicroarcula pellucida]